MKMRTGLMISFTVMLLAGYSVAATNLNSLRGPVSIDETKLASDMKKVHDDTAPIKRNYVQQPPLIPHSIRDYNITLHNNKCLNCHSWKNYVEYGATKISQTHFTDSHGIDLADVSPRRYFCHQCHVTQSDAVPLIENDFRAVDSLSR